MQLKGSVTVFAMILLGLIIGMYLFGFVSPIVQYVSTEVLGENEDVDSLENVEPYTAGDLIKDLSNRVASPDGLAFMGLSLAGAFLTGIAGAGYIGQSILSITIPAFIFSLIANIMFFPVMYTTEAEGLPTEVNILLVIVFNVLLVLTMISFIMGRD